MHKRCNFCDYVTHQRCRNLWLISTTQNWVACRKHYRQFTRPLSVPLRRAGVWAAWRMQRIIFESVIAGSQQTESEIFRLYGEETNQAEKFVITCCSFVTGRLLFRDFKRPLRLWENSFPTTLQKKKRYAYTLKTIHTCPACDARVLRIMLAACVIGYKWASYDAAL